MKYNNILKHANSREINEIIEHAEPCFEFNFDIQIEKEDYQIMQEISGFCFDILISNSGRRLK